MKCFWILLLLVSHGVIAQIFPENGALYTAEEIPKIHISINPDSLEELYMEENWNSDYLYQVQFVFESQAGYDTLQNVGFRFRGNSSIEHIKKSFKISFNTYIPGRKFHGVEKLNLNAENNDPSMLRSRIYWNMCREMGIVASRSNHVEVYVNGDYYGLYQNIEHIDEEFIDSRYGNNSGNLYKCYYSANLDYISNNPNDYKLSPFGHRVYELKTNTEVDDYSKLANFISFLNQSSDSDFKCDFHDYFNVYNYLKVAALDVLTGNWDGYIYNNNNYYLYENPLTNQVEYIPYDVDNTWGIDWLGKDWTTRNIYNWNSSEPRPLFTRLMDEPEYRNMFSWFISNTFSNYFNTTQHRQAVESLHAFIESSALADPYRPLAFGFDEDDFLNALIVAAGGHVDHGVFEFADLREQTAMDQLETITIAPIIMQIKPDFSDLPDVWKVSIVTDGPQSESALLAYYINGTLSGSVEGVATSNGYDFEINIGQEPIQMAYNILVNGENGLTRFAFCENEMINFNQENTLTINELMPSNQSVISDETGNFADWIELYNASSNPINLSKYYLSDNKSAPFKWNLPDVTMNAGAFLLLWADSDMEDGPLHTNFNLSAGGEKVYLFKKQGNELTVMDKVDMPATLSDYSFGRETDGGQPWITFSNSTPNASNQGGTIGLSVYNQDELLCYPNPTNGELNFSVLVNYQIKDLAGRTIQKGRGKGVDLSDYSNGVYFVDMDGVVFQVVKL